MQKFVVNKPVRPEQLASQKNIWHELYRAMLEVVVLKFIPCFTLECPCGSCSRILLAAGAPAVKRGAWMGEMLLLLDDIFHFKIIYTFSCMILARSRVIHSQSIYHAWHHFQLSGEEFGMMLAGCLLASFSGQKNTRHCHPCCHYIFRGMYIYTYVCSFYLFYLCMRYI